MKWVELTGYYDNEPILINPSAITVVTQIEETPGIKQTVVVCGNEYYVNESYEAVRGMIDMALTEESEAEDDNQ